MNYAQSHVAFKKATKLLRHCGITKSKRILKKHIKEREQQKTEIKNT